MFIADRTRCVRPEPLFNRLCSGEFPGTFHCEDSNTCIYKINEIYNHNNDELEGNCDL